MPKYLKLFLSNAIALNAADTLAPVRITILPAGPRVGGIDGREWLHDRPAELVAALNAHPVDIAVDYNHGTEIKAPKGEEAPVAGWMKAGQYRLEPNGQITAAVAWTPRGKASVEGAEYRYISPALCYERTSGRIVFISSVGLVAKPNLVEMPALNSAFNDSLNQPESKLMTPEQLKALCAALGLAESSTPEAIIAQAKTTHTTALNAAQVDIAKLVPRADYEVALNRATSAENKLAEQAKTALKSEATALIDAAVTAGKIAPASKDFYLGLCSDQSGFEKVKGFVASAPVIVSAGASAPAGQPAQGVTLNAETLAIAKMFGNSVEDINKFG